MKELKARGMEVKIKEPSLLVCLVKIFYGKFLAGAFMKLVQDSKNSKLDLNEFFFINLNYIKNVFRSWICRTDHSQVINNLTFLTHAFL